MKKTKDIEYSAGRRGTVIAVFAIILISSIIIRNGLINIQKNRESVSVKGLAERVVRADSAILGVIPISETGDDLESVRDKIDIDVRKIFAYLKKYDIEDNEIEQDIMRVYDKLAQKFYDEHNKAKRFSIDHQLIIKSSNVEAVHKARKNINELLKEGVTLSYDGYNSSYSPRYLFTKLNEVKPEMLSEAMQEAQKAIEQLLKPSNSRVGGIASQGAFSMYSKEATAGSVGIAHVPDMVNIAAMKLIL
ncbi:MAG: SIMPL domain-containing protein [Candidatus Midichloria sp.]|nr:SIMPL domain-containing protein [Candidatus Midichloria sp.]